MSTALIIGYFILLVLTVLVVVEGSDDWLD